MATPRRLSLFLTQVARSLLVTAALLTFLAFANGNADVRFKTWNTENGLPQNSVIGIAQTHDGYIWLATFDGLARFDGVRFKIFRKHDTPELPTNRISRLFSDDQGRLWILTEDTTRIVVYEGGRFKSFSKGSDFETGDMTEPWMLTKEMVLRNGDVEYVYENGAFISRPVSARKLPRVFFDENLVAWIDMGDHYITGREGDLVRVPKEMKLPEKLIMGSSVEIGDALWFPLPYRKPSSAYRFGVDPLWSGPARLARLRNATIETFPLEVNDVTVLQTDRNQNLWIGDLAYGLRRIDAGTLANANRDNFIFETLVGTRLSVRDVFKDREGNIWVGLDNGLQLLRDLAAVKVYTRADGLPSENVYSVFQDRAANIWFGTWPDHLVRYTDGQFRPEKFGLTTALLVDRNSRMWAGNAVLWYRDEGRPWQRFDDYFEYLPLSEINVIAEDADGNIWFGGPKRNITKWDGKALRPFTVNDGLPSDAVTAFLQARDGTIWIGTIAGVARFDGERFVPVANPDGTVPAYVRSLYEDVDGTLWIGTYDSGITRFKNGKIVQITTEHGLFSNGVFCILEDDEGWFWMNSNQGIYRVRRSDLNDFAEGVTNNITSASYGPEDGLLNVEGNGGKQPAGLKSADGRLWFPTAGGMAVVDPKSVHQEERPPDVVIEEIKVDQKEIANPTNELVIEPGQTAVEINYTGISFNNAPTLRFRYRLEGLEAAWTDVGTRRTAYFSHLPYGEYTFRVLAGNRDGVWNEQGAALRVVVERPFNRTYWFYALVSLLVAGVVGLIFYSRVSQLRRIAEAREAYARELLESQERERSRLAMELHDSLGQSLVVIRNRALLGISKKNDDHSMLEQLQEISDASATALQETREIAHTLHPYQIEALGLTTALHSLVDKIEGSSDISFVTKINETPNNIQHDGAVAVYRIAQEWLTNVVKHSSATEVRVSLQTSGPKLTLMIADNGVGFDPQKVKKGLGLRGISERSRMVGGTLSIESGPGTGAELRLVVDAAQQ
jgi:signal transduction histidine kinase/ligand-binding sensor domain-containing protein